MTGTLSTGKRPVLPRGAMQLVVDPYNLWGSRVDARKVPLKPFVVRYGDTLAALAVRFSVTIRDLQRINGMQSDALYEGSILLAPRGTAASRHQPLIPMTCLQVSTAPTASSSVVQPLPTQSSPTHSTPFAPPLPLPPTSPAQASSPLPADVCPGLRHANRLCFYLPSPIHFPFPLTFPHFTTLHFPPLSPPFSPGDITPPPPGVHPGP
ncbi:unnamed protein product, partial [Closterium sp. NIES-53]